MDDFKQPAQSRGLLQLCNNKTSVYLLHSSGIEGAQSSWSTSTRGRGGWKRGKGNYSSFTLKQGVSLCTIESKVGSLKRSVLGPLLFIIYMNDIKNALKYCKSFIFADDTSVSYSDENIKSIRKPLNIDLKLLSG